MEGDRKRRKMENEEDQDEEEKIEEFFALIRRTKEVRDLLRGRLSSSNIGSKEKKDEKKMKEEGEKATGAWNPAFQPEDFLEDDKSAGHGATGPSKTQQQEEEEDKKEDHEGGNGGLDLKLSL